MKLNKKLIVPFLSTVAGLSIAGGLGGAFAWYQYNTQVTTSFVGTSVADSSILQIGHLDGNSNMVWGKDFYPYASGQKQNMIPVTFGQLVTDSVSGKEDCLGPKAYGYPEAGVSGGTISSTHPGYSNWAVIEPNKGFVRFDLYLKCLDASGARTVQKVYMSDLLIDAAAEATGNKDITKAVRIHLDVEDGTNRIISKEAVSGMELFGELDLDGVGGNDKTGGYLDANGVWVNGQTITYGRIGDTQDTIGVSDIVATRGADGKYGTDQISKLICTTKSNADVKITVTAWLEGWTFLTTEVDTSTDPATVSTSPVWNPDYSAGVSIRFGMTFDTGVVRTDA